MLLPLSKKRPNLPILHAPSLIDMYLLLVAVLAVVEMVMVAMTEVVAVVKAKAVEAEVGVAEDVDMANVVIFP